MIKEVGEFVTGLLFPKKCPLCEEAVSVDGFCPECRKELVLLKDGGRVKREHFEEGRIVYEYGGVATALYEFKYGGCREYAKAFAAEMIRELGPRIREWQAEGILAVPLHPKRQKKRGYNQAALLGKELSKALKVPFYEGLVERVKNTLPLKELNAAERQNNLKKAFKMCRNDVKLKTVIIVDDIYTTGQTVEEIAKVLRAGGVEKIYVLALAGGAET